MASEFGMANITAWNMYQYIIGLVYLYPESCFYFPIISTENLSCHPVTFTLDIKNIVEPVTIESFPVVRASFRQSDKQF